MRRLLLSAAAITIAALPVAPAQAGPAVCVVANGFPVCAGTCQSDDQITVVNVGFSTTATASCGGTSTSCTAIRTPCTSTARTTGSGALQCSGGTILVVCYATPAPR